MIRIFRLFVALALALSCVEAPGARSSSEYLAFLPMIARASCSDLCGFCSITTLDHVMGC